MRTVLKITLVSNFVHDHFVEKLNRQHVRWTLISIYTLILQLKRDLDGRSHVAEEERKLLARMNYTCESKHVFRAGTIMDT